MKIGYSRSKINPKLPCQMDGYRERVAQSIHDDLYMNIVYMHVGKPLLFIVLDIIMIDKKLSNSIRPKLSKEFNIPIDCIHLLAIHTHSGPKVSYRFETDIVPDEEYFDFLKQTMINETAKAIKNAIDSIMEIDHIDVEGYFTNRNSMTLPNWKTATIIRIFSLDKKPYFAIVNMACHPTILNGSNLQISSDFVGVLREEYEKNTGIPLVFINAEAGDVSTRLLRKSSDFAEVQRVGKGIANILTRCDNFKAVSLKEFSVSKYTLNIEYDAHKDEFINTMIKQLQNKDKYFDKDSQCYRMSEMFLYRLNLKLQQGYIKLSPTTYIIEFDHLRVIMIPGEIVYNLAHKLRHYHDKEILIFSYANEFNGYAVDIDEYGKYFETFMSQYPKGMADKMIDETIKLFKIK